MVRHAQGQRLHSQDTAVWGSYGFFNVTALAQCMDFIVPMGCELSPFTMHIYLAQDFCTSRLHRSVLCKSWSSPVCVAADCNAASSTIAGPTDPLENMEIEISKGNKLGSGTKF